MWTRLKIKNSGGYGAKGAGSCVVGLGLGFYLQVLTINTRGSSPPVSGRGRREEPF